MLCKGTDEEILLGNPLDQYIKNLNLFIDESTYLFSVTTACTLVLLTYIYSNIIYITYFAILMIAVVSTRHFTYMLDLTSLETLLRRRQGVPYLRFLKIVLADALTLIFTYGVVFYWTNGNTITLSSILDIVNHLRSVESVLDIFVSSNTDLKSTAMAASGLLYAAVIGKGLWSRKSFVRDDEDVKVLAANLLRVGRFIEADKWLDGVQKPDAMLYFYKGAAALGRQDIEEALRCVQLRFRERKVKGLRLLDMVFLFFSGPDRSISDSGTICIRAISQRNQCRGARRDGMAVSATLQRCVQKQQIKSTCHF